MDQRLQQLRRDAIASNDYEAYDAALARAGKIRLVKRRLTVALFHVILDGIHVTKWSHNNHYVVANYSFGVRPEHLIPGNLVYSRRGSGVKLRLLEVETREVIIPSGYLEPPADDEVEEFLELSKLIKAQQQAYLNERVKALKDRALDYADPNSFNDKTNNDFYSIPAKHLKPTCH